jgi:flavin-dependent dehydrogenase
MADEDARDVVVIGGGPAGAAAARAAADAGVRALLLEAGRSQRAKACAGLLPASALALVEARFGPTPEDALATPAVVAEVRLHLGPKETYLLRPDWPAVRVNRRAFDAHLLQRCGAEVRVDARVDRLDERADGVRLTLSTGETIAAGLVIVAAGATSSLAPLGPGRRGLVFSGRARYPGRPVAGRDVLLLGGDALVEIDADGADGVSVTTTTKRPTDWKLAHATGLAFALGPLGLALKKERGAEFGWQARGGAPALGKGRVLLAGDAAGLSLALGLGLEGALRSGLAAGAAAAASALRGEAAPLEAYARLLEQWVRRRTDERRTTSLMRGRVGGFDDRTSLGDALRAAPLARRLLFGHRLRRLVLSLDRAEPPPRGFPV